ncbi:MAG: hypothetical protein GSR84_03035 [Desulfurococcales archaeon]|nr:hypothetical protein [Desulfurococcales archaeon]
MWRRYARVLAGVFLVGALSGLFGFATGAEYYEALAAGRLVEADTVTMLATVGGGLLAAVAALLYMATIDTVRDLREAWRNAERRRRARGAGG